MDRIKLIKPWEIFIWKLHVSFGHNHFRPVHSLLKHSESHVDHGEENEYTIAINLWSVKMHTQKWQLRYSTGQFSFMSFKILTDRIFQVFWIWVINQQDINLNFIKWGYISKQQKSHVSLMSVYFLSDL